MFLPSCILTALTKHVQPESIGVTHNMGDVGDCKWSSCFFEELFLCERNQFAYLPVNNELGHRLLSPLSLFSC